MKSAAADGAEIPAKRTFGGPFFAPALRAFLSVVILLLVCNWHSIYEEDQMAKTAQIISLGANSNWRHFAATTDYYTKDLFSAYYLIATGFYKLTGLPALEALNLFSVFCGVIFFTVMPAFLRRVFNLPPWLSWVVLMNTPILLISFNYGNEAALAMTATALAAFALTFEKIPALVAGAFFYVMAAYSRSDYLLLWPALALLTFRRGNQGLDWRRSLRSAGIFGLVSFILGTSYLALVLRHWPRPEYYESQSTIKLFAAYFVYAPGLAQAVFALIGFVICLVKRRVEYFLLLPAGLQFLPYVTHLDSPKYMLPTVVVMVIFALVGMLPLLKRAPWLLFVLLAAPWFISLSPYGVFGPGRSSFWYVPTNDGPLPTGGYLGFYSKLKEGFYQKRYDQELEQVARLMRLIEARPGAQVAGYFNVQTLRLWAAWHQRWEMPPQDMPFWVHELDASPSPRGTFMIQSSYLYTLKQSPKLRAQLEAAYQEGRVKSASDGPADPFPDVIQVGQSLVTGSDKDLGARILFANAFFQGNQQTRRKTFLKDFQAVAWIPRARFEKERLQIKILYQDNAWVCVQADIPGAIYYSMRFPPRYSRERRPLN